MHNFYYQVMDNLGVLDGEQVEIQPLQPPLNAEGHRVSRSLEPIKLRGGAVDSRSLACDYELSDDWWCGQQIRDVDGTTFVCDPPNACTACAQLSQLPMHGGLPEAAHVTWKVILGPKAPSGDFEKFLEAGPKAVLDASRLLCIQTGMNIPLRYPPVAVDAVALGAADAPSTPAETLLIACESILDSEGKALLEACLVSRTEHSIECEEAVPAPAVDASSAPRKSGSELWKKLSQAVRVKRRVFSVFIRPLPLILDVQKAFSQQLAIEVYIPHGKCARGLTCETVCSLLLSSSDDALLMGEMVSDYLEQAAADDSERAQIRRNEFGWLLQNPLATLEEQGTLPPRFEGLTAGTAIVAKGAASASQGKAVGGSGGEGTKEGGGENKIGYKRRLTNVPQPAAKRSAVTSGVAGAKEGDTVRKEETMEEEEEEEEFFSELQSSQIGKMSQYSKRRLVRLWLRRKLYDEVQEQAFAFSRGLREMLPPGLLSLFTAPEVQCLLGGAPAIPDAQLPEWQEHCLYDLEDRQNGLTKDDERVRWFWESVYEMPPASRADLFRYATGKNVLPRGGFGVLEPKFNVVSLESSDKVDDGALVRAATCHHQVQLPRYSSKDVTAAQLARSVQEGLANTEDADSFEASQRRLMAQVRRQVEASSKEAGGRMTQDILRSLFPNSYMCAKCHFGPVDHHACQDLRSHHGESHGSAKISNACPQCQWFSANLADWPRWDGKIWTQ